ncbi:MAG: adenylate/guanylate cyclase domain-containing protein [Deltaproteobacteria bacterium]|nr:adenylate/guanylate cyclase domain-containing protein [Deltaproteobacteria bacterium]
MVTCVLDGGGVVADSVIGDAIMALFGVPVSQGPWLDAEAAVRCAVQMSAALDRLNARRVAAGGLPVELGIGVHTGEVVAGNIGIPERMEYTVIGDTVNLCSRIEGLTRDLGVRVLLSKSCVEHLADSQAVAICRDGDRERPGAAGCRSTPSPRERPLKLGPVVFSPSRDRAVD